MTKNSILLRKKKRKKKESGKWNLRDHWKVKPSSRFMEKERLHSNISIKMDKNQLTSHCQVEGSESKIERLNDINTLLSPE